MMQTRGRARRRSPYVYGDDVHGLIYHHGTCLTEGKVISCTWDERLESWRVTAEMFLNLTGPGPTVEKRYLWVDAKGVSDYLEPGKIHRCKYDPAAPHRDGCPHPL